MPAIGRSGRAYGISPVALERLSKTVARDRPPGIPRQQTGFADDQRRADVAAARASGKTPCRSTMPAASWSSTNPASRPILLRRHAPSPRGLRLRDDTPCGHWQMRTVVAALRVDGLHAPAVFEGPLDNPTFLASVEQNLVPTLRLGEVVVLDHLAMHQPPEGQAAIERVGACGRFLRSTVLISIRSNAGLRS